ncbi:MAG: hypothetical protein JST00_44815 [Deltaproteobacteria bacterium]|nr:hypothetical protein [Deltaproteobacteria bacterium]
MRSDVHQAALRAAAKVAFSMAFFTVGCAAATDPVDEGEALGDEPETTESDISKAKPKASKVATKGCSKKPKPSCGELVNAAFPTEGFYPGTKQNVSKEVQACCVELLTNPGDAGLGMTAHRWDCCANATPGADIGMACTPWGPPVPPSMGRRRGALALPASWLARLAQVA